MAARKAATGGNRMRSGKQTVGIVGLGIMGGAFARNLVASGFRVIGFDVDPARRRAARKA
ncbi:MAG: NAD(P)-binding domain-containing protein, partial [Xanthobacteraceae bacterium]